MWDDFTFWYYIIKYWMILWFYVCIKVVILNSSCYIGIGTANGYGCTLEVAVAVDSMGNVVDISIIQHRETSSFMRRVLKSSLLSNLKGKNYVKGYALDLNIDAVSGATYTCRALLNAVKNGCRIVARENFNLIVQQEKISTIKIGFMEVVMIVLFLIGFLARQRWFLFTKTARWISKLTGLVVLGFLLNNSITITFFNKLLLGFLPEWRPNISWYLLIGGVFMCIVFNTEFLSMTKRRSTRLKTN